MNQRFRRNVLVLVFIIIAAIFHFIFQHTSKVNRIHNIEDSNAYHWQKYMNEEEYLQLNYGMSYIDVVKIAMGKGEQKSEGVFLWQDEILMTQGYEIHFIDDKLVEKKIIEKRGYSTR